MTRRLDRPFGAALVVLSGLLLLPFLSVRGEEFRWQTFGGVYGVYADLEVVKTSMPPVPLAVGQQLPYSLTVRNLGPSNATGVVVDDTLPGQTSYLSDTCTGAYNGGTNTWTWTVGSLLVNAQTTCDLTLTVDAAGALVNSAFVSGDQADPVGANDVSTVTDVARVLSIPSLSLAGRVTLLALLGAVALVLLRRR